MTHGYIILLTNMMSFSEIETVSKRASKASGYSWGVAEEVGKSIKILEMFSLPGISLLNGYLKKIKNNHPKKLKKITKDNSSQNELCPIYAGMIFLDHCLKLEEYKFIKFYNLNYPLLILPFISRSSEIVKKPLLVIFNENKYLVNSNKTIMASNKNNEYLKNVDELSVEFKENKDLFSEKEWKELYKLSEDTFVSETDSLKNSAAGAGLTDND